MNNKFYYEDFHTVLWQYRPEGSNYSISYPKSLIYWKGLLLCVNKSRNILDSSEHCGRRAREFISKLCRIPLDRVMFRRNQHAHYQLSMELRDYKE